MPVKGEAIVLREQGEARVLRLEEQDFGDPGPGQVRLRTTAAGVNFHDVYVRSGAYQTLKLPGIPGLEAVGVVEAVGAGVSDFAIGQRAAWMDPAYGGYSTWKVVDAAVAVPIPDAVDDVTAAAIYLKGLTAHALVAGVHPVREGERVLVQAAAGGVGRLLAQMAKARGAYVIGTAGSPEKAAIAQESGCDAVILYRDEEVAPRVQELTGGKGVDVAFDAVGRDTFDGSLASLGMRGHLVNYGQSSGPIAPFEISRLAPKSLSLTWPFVWAYVATPELLRAAAADLFGAVAGETLKVGIGAVFPLAEAWRAHAALEARGTGPFVLDCR